jgi:hypothetical protein
VVPKLPRGAVVTIDFGFNGTDLYQVGATANALRNGNCVDGTSGSIFGQVSFCNGINFFNAASRDESEGKLVVPSEGTSSKIVASAGTLGSGQNCPETRNFDMVDQDPSDNVTTFYLLDPATGQTAQDTTSNTANIPDSTLLANGSDNTLLDAFMDPLLGCTPFQAPDLANNNAPTSSQALDELLSAAHQPTVAALVPENDEMVLNNSGQFDVAKTNLYREEIGQAPVSAQNNKTSSPAMFCQNMVDIQTPFLAANVAGSFGGRQPVHLPGEQARHVLQQPLLRHLRPEGPGHGHAGRLGRGDRGDPQHRQADGDQHRVDAGDARLGDAWRTAAEGPDPPPRDGPVGDVSTVTTVTGCGGAGAWPSARQGPHRPPR